MDKIGKKKKNMNGFALVEAIIGIFVLSIGLVAVASMYAYGTGSSIKSERLQAAVQVAGKEMERIKNSEGEVLSDVIKINSQNNPSSVYYKEMLEGYGQEGFSITDYYKPINVDSHGTGLYLIKVEVTWKDSEESKHILYGYVNLQGGG